jgi:predicted phage terminase large subunit-like protein
MTDEARLTLAQRKEAFESPLGLSHAAHPDYEQTRLHVFLSLIWMQITLAALFPRIQSAYRNVAIMLPPRMSKSETFSISGPSWSLMRWPQLHVVDISYEQGLSEIFGRQARNLVEFSGPEAFGVKLNQASSAGTNWSLTGMEGRPFDGSYRAASIGGSLLGRGANIMVLDDCVKPGTSKFVRDQEWDWYTTVAKSRLNPGGVMVIVQQRVSEDDLAGRAMREEGLYASGGLWTPICLPLFAERITKDHIPNLRGTLPDPLGRADGEILWPDRYSPLELEQRRHWPSHVYASVLQQRPTLKGGTTFDMDNVHSFQDLGSHYRLALGGRNGEPERFELVPVNSCKTIYGCDLATSLRTRSDYTVFMQAKVTPKGQVLITDVIREHLDGPSSLEVLEVQDRLYDPQRIYVEGSAFQLSWVQLAKSRGMPIEKWLRPAKEDKQGTALLTATQFANEKIFLPEHASWLRVFTEEISRFPMVPHDDIVDALGIIASVTRRGFLGQPEIRIVGGNDGPERGWTRVA